MQSQRVPRCTMCPAPDPDTGTHLVQVLGLDFVAGFTHLAGLFGIGEDQLVDDNVVCVNSALGKLLDESLRLVERQELGNTHADECGLFLGRWEGSKRHYEDCSRAAPTPLDPLPSGTYRVLELLADGADDGQRLLQLGGQLVGIHVA